MKLINSGRLYLWIIIALVLVVTVMVSSVRGGHVLPIDEDETMGKGFVWTAPDTTGIPNSNEGMLIRYGRELIAHTSYFLGPKGTVAHITNGMNCQNCHLDAGTKTWGNNYSAVFSTYPKFRERSGTVENVYKRINDCIDRSLNGQPMDSNSREMQAISAYIRWVGKNVPRETKPWGAGIRDLAFMDRSADPSKGRIVFIQKCQRCHGPEGKGLLDATGIEYIYPPLWGDNSYNKGAGLYRVSRFAGYVRDNMPFDAPYNSAGLTTEEAWDVAAFVNSQSRPDKDYRKDYPNVAGKPIDHPFGPFKDAFSEEQHKYGPFEPIRMARSTH